MKLKVILTLFLTMSLLNSCFSFLGFNEREYNYEYKSFAKKIDFSRGNWLLTPVTSTSYGINEKVANDLLQEFLTSKLRNRLKISNKLKDQNNKYLFPFDLDFDNLKNNFSTIKELSKCDYLISSKIFYLDDTSDIGVRQNHRTQNLKNSGYKSACKISFVVHDLKTEKEIFNLDCLGYVWVNDEIDGGFKIYQKPKSASADVMKRIIKKIK